MTPGVVNWLPWSVWKISGRPWPLQRLDAEVGLQGIRPPPCQDPPARPGHDGDEIPDATPHRDVGDIGAPDLFGAVDREAFRYIRPLPVLGVGRGGPRLPTVWRQARLCRQPPHPLVPDTMRLALQVTRHLPTAIPWGFRTLRIHQPHRGQLQRSLPLRRRVKRRAADPDRSALPAHGQSAALWVTRLSRYTSGQRSPSGGFRQEIPLHNQPADLRMQLLELALLFAGRSAGRSAASASATRRRMLWMPLGSDEAELPQMGADRVHKLGQLMDEEVPRPTGHQNGLLDLCLDRHEAHRRSEHGGADRLGICGIRLPAPDEELDAAWRHHPHVMPHLVSSRAR